MMHPATETDKITGSPWSPILVSAVAVLALRTGFYFSSRILWIIVGLSWVVVLLFFVLPDYFMRTIPYFMRRTTTFWGRALVATGMVIAMLVANVYFAATFAAATSMDVDEAYRNPRMESEVVAGFAGTWPSEARAVVGQPPSLAGVGKRILFVEYTPAGSITVRDQNGVERSVPATDVFHVPSFQYDLPVFLRARNFADATIIVRIRQGRFEAPNVHRVIMGKDGQEVKRDPVFVPEWNFDAWDRGSDQVFSWTFKTEKFSSIPGTAVNLTAEDTEDVLPDVFESLGLPMDMNNRVGVWCPELTFARWVAALFSAVF